MRHSRTIARPGLGLAFLFLLCALLCLLPHVCRAQQEAGAYLEVTGPETARPGRAYTVRWAASGDIAGAELYLYPDGATRGERVPLEGSVRLYMGRDRWYEVTTLRLVWPGEGVTRDWSEERRREPITREHLCLNEEAVE